MLRPMIHMLTAEEIEREANAKGLSAAQLCRLANINQSTFQRWKAGAMPQVPTYNRVLAIIEAAEKKEPT